MKKSVLITISLFFISLTYVIGQIIPNPGFETWVTTGNYQEPTGWGTVNPTTSIVALYPVTKDSLTQYSGSACIKIQTLHYAPLNVNVLGAAASGKIHVILSPFSYTIDSGFTANSIPQALNGWYKDTIGGPRDSVYIITYYTKWDTATHSRFTVAHGSMVTGTNNITWTQFNIPITLDTMPLVFPDSGMVELHSSRLDTATAGTTLWVDDLTLTTGINEIDPLNSNYDLYPNPVAGTLNIKNNNLFRKNASMVIYDEMGRAIGTFNLNDNISSINTSNFSSGIYFYQIISNNQSIMKKGKFIVQ